MIWGGVDAGGRIMAVDSEVVRAIAETLTETEIKTYRSAAVAETLKGPHTVMTSSSFQDQSSAGIFVERSAREVLQYCNAALDYLADLASGEERSNPKMNHLDMRGQSCGW